MREIYLVSAQAKLLAGAMAQLVVKVEPDEDADVGMTPEELVQMVLEIHSEWVGATMSSLDCSEEDAAAEVLTELASSGRVSIITAAFRHPSRKLPRRS